jgi:hypothetical protein
VRIPMLPLLRAGETARCAQHAAANLNRHVGIVGAAQIRVNVRIFLPTVDSANGPWPTCGVGPRRGPSRSSSAWLGRSQKDGLPAAAGE